MHPPETDPQPALPDSITVAVSGVDDAMQFCRQIIVHPTTWPGLAELTRTAPAGFLRAQLAKVLTIAMQRWWVVHSPVMVGSVAEIPAGGSLPDFWPVAAAGVVDAIERNPGASLEAVHGQLLAAATADDAEGFWAVLEPPLRIRFAIGAGGMLHVIAGLLDPRINHQESGHA